MRNMVILAAVAAAIVLAAPATHLVRGQGDDMHALWQVVSRLEDRVEKLEAIVTLETPGYYEVDVEEMQAPPAGRSAESQPPDHLMVFEGLESVEVNPDAQEELKRLTREAEALQRTVDQMERSVTASTTTSSYRGRRTHTARRDEGALLGDYKRKSSKKWGEVKRLEKEIAEPKQLIIGHWENKVITLRTTRDVSNELNKLDRGGKLTWEGRRVREDSDSQEWVVSRVWAVTDY